MSKQIKKSSKKVIILGLISVLIGSFFLIQKIGAASISSREVRISSSIPSAAATYDFLGTTTASTTKCIRMRFCTSPDINGSCTGPTGLNTTGASKSTTGWNIFNQANWTFASVAANEAKFTYVTGENGGAASSWVVNSITNPSSAGSFYVWLNTYNNVDCASSPIDDGVVATAAVTGVTVSATVVEALTFTVAEVDSGTCTVSGGTNKTTTASTVPFGTVNADAFYNGCQSLTVATNAGSGYDVTVGETDQLTSGSNQIADGACDGTCTESTEAAWATGGNNGFGYCMDDVSGDAAQTADAGWGTNYCGASPQYFKIIADTGESEVKQNIMQSAGAVSGDSAYVGFRLSVDAAQQPGTYSNTVSYIVTPRY
jgi:hypothetical protein